MRFSCFALLLFLLPSSLEVVRAQGTGAGSWGDRFAPPGIEYVSAVEATESEFLLAGSFRFDGDESRRQVLLQDRLTGTWSVLADFGPILDHVRDASYVTVLASTGDAVYMAGGFTMGDIRYLARWDWSTGSWSGLGGGPGAPVVAFDVGSEQQLSVIGHERSGTTWTSFVKRWDGQGWTDLGDPLPGFARDVTTAGGATYLAFSRADGSSFRDEVLRWSGAGWEIIGRATSTDQHGASLRALVGDIDGSVYAAGRFNAIGGIPARSIARWNGEGWHAPGSGLGFTNIATVYDVAVHSGSVYAGGYLYSEDPAASYLAHWDGTRWRSMDSGVDGPVEHLSAVSGGVLAAGSFAVAGPEVAHGTAWWSQSEEAWHALRQETGHGVTGKIQSMATDAQGRVYIAGELSAAGSTVVRNVAVWDGDGWISWDHRFDGPVRHITAGGKRVYFGGSFTSAGGEPAGGVAAWDGRQRTWSVPPERVDGRRIEHAGPLAAIGHRLYAAVRLEGEDGPSIARWDGDAWHFIGRVAGTYNPNVKSLATNGSMLAVAGRFDSIDGYPVRNVAVWNGREWVSPDDDLSGDPRSLAWHEERLYAGGMLFTGEGARGQVAEWNGSGWRLLPRPFAVPDGCEGAAASILSHGGFLYAGGGAWVCVTGGGTGTFDHGISRWDGSAWQNIGGSIQGVIEEMAAHADDLYVGGNFARTGNNPALNFGHLRLPVTAADATYFPLAEGNEWTFYETIDPPDAPPDTVILAPSRVERSVLLVDDEYFPMSMPRVLGDTLRADSLGRIWSYEGGESYLLYDFTLPDGATYTYHEYIVIVRRGRRVETVAGVFENCIELQFHVPGVVDSDWTFVFAPEVGPIVALGGLGEYTRLYAAVVDGRIISSRETPIDPPTAAVLSAAYPNPFTSTARFTVSVPAAEPVTVSLFDVLGREVVRLHDGLLFPGVAHSFEIDNLPLAAGVYYIRVKGETFVRTGRVVRQ